VGSWCAVGTWAVLIYSKCIGKSDKRPAERSRGFPPAPIGPALVRVSSVVLVKWWVSLRRLGINSASQNSSLCSRRSGVALVRGLMWVSAALGKRVADVRDLGDTSPEIRKENVL
jgi:hypothetical protein